MTDWEAMGEEIIPTPADATGAWTPSAASSRTPTSMDAGHMADKGERRRTHGNDERRSLENIRQGARAYTEMLLAAAA